MTVIHLGAGLLRHSSDLPARSASSLNARLLGVAPSGGCRVSPAAPMKQVRRLVSVALFLALGACLHRRLLRPAVSRHSALWSPDFPLAAQGLQRLPDRL